MSQVSTDQESTLSMDQTLGGERTQEVEQLTLVRAGLEDRVAELEQEIRDKEEQHQQQVRLVSTV